MSEQEYRRALKEAWQKEHLVRYLLGEHVGEEC